MLALKIVGDKRVLTVEVTEETPTIFFSDNDLCILLKKTELLMILLHEIGGNVVIGRLGILESDGIYRETNKCPHLEEPIGGEYSFYAKL